MTLQAMSTSQPAWLQAVLNSHHTVLSIKSPNEQRYYLEDCLIKLHNRVWIGGNTALQTKLIVAFHSSPIGGHSGVNTTYHKIKKFFHWKGMKQDAEEYIKQCAVCQQAKHEHTHPARLLQPRPIPEGAGRIYP
jgi:hypothetical protein